MPVRRTGIQEEIMASNTGSAASASAPLTVPTQIGGQSGGKNSAGQTVFGVLAAISVCHLLNDLIQSLIPAIYPLLKDSFQLNFTQVGLITLTFQCTASLLQPLVGLVTDKRSLPYSLPVGMTITLCGLLLLSRAGSFAVILVAAAMVGMGSAVFHPESSRVARMASGGQHGLAQSLFQVGGNAGSAIGPLLAALFVMPRGQGSIAWFSMVALVAIGLLGRLGLWYRDREVKARQVQAAAPPANGLTPRQVKTSVAVLLALVFSKYVYLTSLTSYYTFYLMNRFGVSRESSQLHLFVFLGAVAAGTIIGGPVGDRIGRKRVIWCSILGVLPFTLALPFANLAMTSLLTVIIGLVLSSAFSAIVVFAQELVPGRVGLISGLFFGFAFGIAGLGAAVLGKLADHTSIAYVYHVCSFLPLIGLLTALLPNVQTARQTAK